jgi:hypothetical protein
MGALLAAQIVPSAAAPTPPVFEVQGVQGVLAQPCDLPSDAQVRSHAFISDHGGGTSPTPSASAAFFGGSVASAEKVCLGTLLSTDAANCDPAFEPPASGIARFERRLCNNCRANGIACLADRVRMVTQDQESAFHAVDVRKTRQFWHQSTAVPQCFRIYNDKARCTGLKLVVFQSSPPLTVAGEPLLMPPTVETGPGGCSIVRLWCSYGTLTLNRSRKFRTQLSSWCNI